jgi:hypothetical protein
MVLARCRPSASVEADKTRVHLRALTFGSRGSVGWRAAASDVKSLTTPQTTAVR